MVPHKKNVIPSNTLYPQVVPLLILIVSVIPNCQLQRKSFGDYYFQYSYIPHHNPTSGKEHDIYLNVPGFQSKHVIVRILIGNKQWLNN